MLSADVLLYISSQHAQDGVLTLRKVHITR